MKQTISSLLLILMLCGVSSCKNELDPLEDGNHRILKKQEKPMLKTVRLSFGGDCISESEEPLIRADDSDTYTAINVFRTSTTAANADTERYAYGLFKSKDIPESVSIDLITGYKYDFKATILVEVEGLDKVHLNPDYGHPFVIATKGATNAPDFNGFPKGSIGNFIYSYKEYPSTNDNYNQDDYRNYFRMLKYGFALVKPQDETASAGCYRNPRVKRYYGEATGFELSSSSSEKVELKMDYKSFGLQINITGMTGGTLTVEDKSNHSTQDLFKPRLYADKLLFPKDLIFTNADVGIENPWECIYSMNDFDADSETFDLEFTWDKGYGISKTIPCHIEVHPNKKKILNVNLTESMNESKGGNIVLLVEDEMLSPENPQSVTE